ncbi:MAG TPA: toll/interleukin-1 receptor domain-containing protein [Candidatus Limnocylindrales bacterium]|jgi:hypothetical protein|nr:toll/interleukin-1 receptor domain-containing protein [Candidatus Limnocylindrales bacterium]
MDDNPVVFLSHSSKDKAALMALKDLLDARAAGSLEFFLSSDGQSIRLGRNWVTKISDALTQCKLMFVFLSPASIDSKWVHFEAGCAYAKDIDVVPVCLPGMDFNQVAQPLSLLQGFNLHTHDALSNLARICNQNFKRRLKEAFTQEEFSAIFADSLLQNQGFFGDTTWAILDITVEADRELREGEDFDPIPLLAKSATDSNVQFVTASATDPAQQVNRRLEFPGCNVYLKRTKRTQMKGDKKTFEVDQLTCFLSSQLFHINAPLLDHWYTQAPWSVPWNVKVRFKANILGEKVRHELTTKLFSGGIRVVDFRAFDFQGFGFCLETETLTVGVQGQYDERWCITFKTSGSLHEKQLPLVINKLFQVGVLTTDPYIYSQAAADYLDR